MSLLLLFNRAVRVPVQHTIVGSVTTSLTPAAVVDFTQHPEIDGDVTVQVTPAATMHYTTLPHIVGSVTVTVTPAATMLATVTPTARTDGRIIFVRRPRRRRSFEGAVGIAVTPHAVLAFTAAPKPRIVPAYHRRFVGSVAISIRPTAAVEWTQAVVLPAIVDRTPATQPRPTAPAELASVVNTVQPTTDAVVSVVDPVTHPASQSVAIVGSVSITLVPSGDMQWATGSRPRPTVLSVPWTPDQDEHNDDALLYAAAYQFLTQ
jgi:hypothetical protein